MQKAPLGGKKDETPPELDTIRSTPNYITNFDLDQIVLRFDEFIQLKNAFEQIVYSPPLATRPEIIQRGKKLTIKLPENAPLKENTTYTINFGDAIVDLNEGNPLSNFRYVFSTGDVIDSLSISGKVVDDLTREPAEDVYVMLYDKLSDSIVFEEAPYYFAKTNKSGSFEIQNLRSDTFKVVVLNDGNLNLKYDEGEAIGFLDSFIYTTDSTPPPLSLNIFEPLLAIELLDEEFSPFKMKFEFRGQPINITVGNYRDSVYWLTEINKDSLILWHDNSIPNDTFYILEDTITYKRRVFDGDIEPFNYRKSNLKRNGGLEPGQPIEFEFPYAINSIDSSKFELSDSLIRPIESIVLDSLNPRKVKIEYNFSFGDTMALYIEPGGVSMVNGSINDTITELVIPESREKFGIIDLTIDSLNAEQQYIMQLMDGDKEIRRRLISGENQAKFRFDILPPKTYSVRLTLDANKNGRWDPGDYWKKTQSEVWQETKLEELRQNWELEAKVEWKP
ncbi:Ig-like domain-containing protein [Portibacter marinus]|uniref:Ig-like domain-containing protein n=1 Tax=Portibacter marinus TaxID=2898660 RepID=UPI001F1FAF63|nr:Ig-like domain-containing protein [Portibacter marinus]